MNAWMGIDGGGSNIRIVIVDNAMNVLVQIERTESANPNAIGREKSAALIHEIIHAALDKSPVKISGLGIGVAGAAVIHSEAWLREIVTSALPGVFAVPSSDYEIALVGALGERRGILLLSGTGSVAFGVNEHGESLQVGGWGYLFGDEGSGYWIGLEALRTMIHEADGTHSYGSTLPQRVQETLGFAKAHDVILWLYGTQAPRTRDIAALAQIVLDEAATDARAGYIIEMAAQSLHRLAMTLVERLTMYNPPIAFGGGLLMSDNALSRRVCALLNLTSLPIPKYSSVVGAALLAKLRKESLS
jgi:glucosamine kinase